MIVGLHDSDNKGFPNFALMKISKYHKAVGDTVEWWLPMKTYDRIYSSKVFTFTNVDQYLPEYSMLGGTGYDIKSRLPEEIESVNPDYDLYGTDYSVGFLTRGCFRKCPWCLVPTKEGDLRPYRDISEVAEHKNVVLMDNNILGSEYGLKQIEKIGKMDIRIDFNQGLDARLIDDSVAKLLAKCKWYKPLRLACDSSGIKPFVKKSVELLRKYGCSPKNYFCYVLVKDINDALDRVMFLKELNVDPFAQPYRDFSGTEPTREQKRFARWVNHKAVFKIVKWENYK